MEMNYLFNCVSLLSNLTVALSLIAICLSEPLCNANPVTTSGRPSQTLENCFNK